MTDERLLFLSEIAQTLQMQEASARRFIKETPGFPAAKIKGRWAVIASDLWTWVRAQQVRPGSCNEKSARQRPSRTAPDPIALPPADPEYVAFIAQKAFVKADPNGTKRNGIEGSRTSSEKTELRSRSPPPRK